VLGAPRRPRAQRAGPLARTGGQAAGRRLLRRLRGAGPRDPLRPGDRRRRAPVRPGDPRRRPHRRMRAPRRRPGRHGRPHRRARRRGRRRRGDPRLGTVRDLVVGSGIEFADRGTQSSRASRASGGSTPSPDTSRPARA
jgi:hypothetical protein